MPAAPISFVPLLLLRSLSLLLSAFFLCRTTLLEQHPFQIISIQSSSRLCSTLDLDSSFSFAPSSLLAHLSLSTNLDLSSVARLLELRSVISCASRLYLRFSIYCRRTRHFARSLITVWSPRFCTPPSTFTSRRYCTSRLQLYNPTRWDEERLRSKPSRMIETVQCTSPTSLTPPAPQAWWLRSCPFR